MGGVGGDSLVPVRVIPHILHVLSQGCQKHLHLRLCPPQPFLEYAHSHAINSSKHVLHLPSTQKFHARMLWPRVARQLIYFFNDVLVTPLLTPFFPMRGIVDRRPELSGRGQEGVGELLEGAIGGKRAVITPKDACHALKLYPATGFEVPLKEREARY